MTTLGTSGILVLGNGQRLLDLREAAMIESLRPFEISNSTLGFALAFLLRWKMFDPELAGELDLSNVVFNAGTDGRLTWVSRTAVAQAFMVNDVPFIDSTERPMDDLLREYDGLQRTSGEGFARLREDRCGRPADWLKLAETNGRLGQLALLFGKDRGYAISLDIEGLGYYVVAKRILAEEDLVAATPLFLRAREARLRAARVCYLLAEEDARDIPTLVRNLSFNLSLVGTIDMHCLGFEEGMNLKLLVLPDLMARYQASSDPVYLRIMLERLTNIGTDYARDGKFVEFARTEKTRADVQVALGKKAEAREIFGRTAHSLERRLAGADDLPAWEIIRDCWTQIVALLGEEGHEDLIASAREQLARAQGHLGDKLSCS
ncbi:MAG: hypothetical protein WC901_08625 [Candidatus Margulisiibacteriota bacterium]